MTKQLVKYSVAVMTTLLALAILWQFRIVLVFILISITLAATLRPLVTQLSGRSIWVRMGLILLYLVTLGGFIFLLFLTGKGAIIEIQQLAGVISTQDEWRLPTWLEGSLFQQILVTRLLPPSKLFQAATYGQVQFVLPTILGVSQGIATVVGEVVVILIMSLYWIVNKNHFERLWLSLLASGQRKYARDVWQTIEPNLGAYIRSQVIHSLLIGVLLGMGYWVLGSPYPILLAFASAVACLIPFLGVALAMILPLLVGLLASMPHTVYLVLYSIAVIIALAIWVKPRLYARRWDNPILTLIIIIAMANAFGLLGIIIAPPLSAIFQILWNLLLNQRIVSGANAQYSDLTQRQKNVWENISAMGEPAPQMVTNTMQRLSHLIENAGPILQAAQEADPSEVSPTNTHQAEQE
jgi:predicted PurR-regulated permease PerM